MSSSPSEALQRDREVERLAKRAKLPPYMWDTLDGLAALGRFRDAAQSATPANARAVAERCAEICRKIKEAAKTDSGRWNAGKCEDRILELAAALPETYGEAAHTKRMIDTALQSATAPLPADPGTEKLLRDMLDRAYKMMLMAGYRVAEVDSDHNDPIIAWMSDARRILYGSGPQPDLARLT